MSETTLKTNESRHTISGTELHFTDRQTSAVWQQAEATEALVFMDAGYVESAGELKREYEKYDPYTYMLTAAKNGEIVASGRIIGHSDEAGFKTINDVKAGLLSIDEDGWRLLDSVDPRTVIEVGTLSIKKEWRAMKGVHMGLNMELYGALLGIGRELDAPYLLASFDEKYFRRFQRYFGDEVIQLGPAVDYMGSPTVPVIMNLENVYADLPKRGFEPVVEILDDAQACLTYDYGPNGSSRQQHS